MFRHIKMKNSILCFFKENFYMGKKNMIIIYYTKNKTIAERFLEFYRSVSHRDTVEATVTTTDREVKTKGGTPPVHTLFLPVKVVRCKQMYHT